MTHEARDARGGAFFPWTTRFSTTGNDDDFPSFGNVGTEVTKERFPGIIVFEGCDLFVVVAVGAEKFSATFTFGDEFHFGGG
jgi:hypothetical protein